MPKQGEEGGTPINAANPQAQPVPHPKTGAPDEARAAQATRAKLAETHEAKAGGFVDNLKALDFSRVVSIIEEGAGAALSRDWFGVVRLAGELASVLGTLGQNMTAVPFGAQSGSESFPTPRFPVMNAAEIAPHFDRFDKAAAQFDQARGNTFAIPPQKFGGGSEPGSAPALALDPQTVLVALEFFGKLVDALRAWRNRNK